MSNGFWVPTSPPIDLTEWTFNLKLSNKTVGKAVGEALKNALEDERPWFDFPIMFGEEDGAGGPPISDPLTIYLGLPLGNSESSEMGYVYWSFLLTELVDELIEGDVNLGESGMKIRNSDALKCADAAKKIADALRALADRLDAVIEQ